MRLHRQSLPRLYALTDRTATGLSHCDMVSALVSAGVLWIQVREKTLTDAELCVDLEQAVMSLPAEVRIIVNDRVDMALATSADGVHVGEDDLSPVTVRMIPGAGELIVGCSTHDERAAVANAALDEVDYVAIGPIFRSSTKNARQPLGLDVIRRIRTATEKPIVAIGGIDASNIAAVLEAGADMAAVISALYRGGSIVENAQRLIAAAGEAA